MKSSLFLASLAISLPFTLLGAEPSAFGAGNINNPNPYGLTSSEKALLQNKKNLRKVVVKTNNQANEVDSLRERIDGIQSIVESISVASRKNKLSIKNLNKKNDEDLKNSNEFDKRFSETVEVNTKDIEKINLMLLEMSKLVDKINTTYVTKNEFNRLVNDFNKFKTLVTKEFRNGVKPKKTKLDLIQNADIATKAKAYYDKQYYTKALEYYQHLIKNKYKPARAHYMVGEIYYYRKDYANAIAYYKKSASLYSKASYMPVLMVHTAISMDKTNDKKNAKTFYNAVIAKYPKSSAAKIAAKRLLAIK